MGGRGGGGRTRISIYGVRHSLGAGHLTFLTVLSYCTLTFYNCVQSSENTVCLV